MQTTSYPSDLTDAQWALLEPMLPKTNPLGRPPSPGRPIFNGILYVLRGGIPWRFLPTEYGPWQTVYGKFRCWKQAGVWKSLNDRLRTEVRKARGKRARPTGCILDSQTVRSADHAVVIAQTQPPFTRVPLDRGRRVGRRLNCTLSRGPWGNGQKNRDRQEVARPHKGLVNHIRVLSHRLLSIGIWPLNVSSKA